jgi:hypothetical protein
MKYEVQFSKNFFKDYIWGVDRFIPIGYYRVLFQRAQEREVP